MPKTGTNIDGIISFLFSPFFEAALRSRLFLFAKNLKNPYLGVDTPPNRWYIITKIRQQITPKEDKEMKMATHKTHTAYIVIDHEDNARSYQFEDKESALRWKQELAEEFETDPENVVVVEREYDEFGNWITQRYI